MDINDETPTFRSESYVGEINENAQSNTAVTFAGAAVPQIYDYDQVRYLQCYIYADSWRRDGRGMVLSYPQFLKSSRGSLG